jgi:hypothetical protein
VPPSAVPPDGQVVTRRLLCYQCSFAQLRNLPHVDYKTVLLYPLGPATVRTSPPSANSTPKAARSVVNNAEYTGSYSLHLHTDLTRLGPRRQYRCLFAEIHKQVVPGLSPNTSSCTQKGRKRQKAKGSVAMVLVWCHSVSLILHIQYRYDTA